MEQPPSGQRKRRAEQQDKAQDKAAGAAGAAAREDQWRRYHYVATAHKATAVVQCVRGHFTSADQLNLVLARNSELVVYALGEDGLVPVLETPVYGRIEKIALFRPPLEPRDLLLVVTAKAQFFVVGFDPADGRLKTRSSGSVRRPQAKRHTDALDTAAIVDPHARFLAFFSHDHVIDLLPMDGSDGVREDSLLLRVKESPVLACCALHTPASSPAQLAVLHRDRHLKARVAVYQVLPAERELRPAPLQHTAELDPRSSLLVPVPEPLGGFLVAGGDSVTYVPLRQGDKPLVAALPPGSSVVAWSAIDPGRFLLGDESGALLVVALERAPAAPGSHSARVSAVRVAEVGTTSAAVSLAYLDSGVVFVGSATGNSQLVRLLEQPDESGASVRVVEQFPSLAPVVDMCVTGVDRHGRGRLVACSGCGGDGSLRSVSCGVAVNEVAEVEMPGIQGLWSMRGPRPADGFRYLVQSYVGETRVLQLTDSSLEEIDLPGFEPGLKSLFCGQVRGGLLLQVTAASVRLASAPGAGAGGLVAEWAPAGGQRISVAHANETECLVVVGGRRLALLEVLPPGAGAAGGLRLVSEGEPLDFEVSCVDVSPLRPLPGAGHHSARLAAVGLWVDHSVLLLELPSLRPTFRMQLEGEVLPRSVLLADLDGPRLLVGMGDGHLVHAPVLAASLTAGPHARLSVGTQPVVLVPLPAAPGADGGTHVLACCDRPSLVFTGSRGQVLCSNLNTRDVFFAAPFGSPDFPNCVAMATDARLVIGATDSQNQRVHSQEFRLAGSASAVCADQATGLLVTAVVAEPGLTELRLVDDQTFEVLDTFRLERQEECTSVVPLLVAASSLAPQVQGGAPASAPTAGASSSSSSSAAAAAAAGAGAGAASDSAAAAGAAAAGAHGPAAMDVDGAASNADGLAALVVGTALVESENDEPTRGRVLVLRVHERRLELLSADPLGPVYTMAPYAGSRLVVSQGPNVRLFELEWSAGSAASDWKPQVRVAPRCNHSGHMVVVSLATRGPEILVGDLMRSLMVLRFEPISGELVEVARDFETRWTRTCAVLAPGTYLLATDSFDLVVLARDTGAEAPEEQERLKLAGLFHLGDPVSRVAEGSLVIRHPEPDPWPTYTFLATTLGGAVVMVAGLSPEAFRVLEAVQKSITGLVRGLGSLRHEEWRSADRHGEDVPAEGFVDGDVVELFLGLAPEMQQRVALAAGTSVEELSRRVEELVRLR